VQPTLSVDDEQAERTLQYAGFWIRFLAWLIDRFVLAGISFVVFMLMGMVVIVIEEAGGGGERVNAVGAWVALAVLYAVGWLYYACMEASRAGATLGKLAVGLRVLDIDGERPTFVQTSVRFFARLASAITLGFGFLMIAFTKRKQSMHDMGANTIVVNRVSRVLGFAVPPPLPRPPAQAPPTSSAPSAIP
jgi:uncharacterized RDD family membrane protein YckC